MGWEGLLVNTSLLIFLAGILFLKHVEDKRRESERKSNFTEKWAALLFDTCHDYLNNVERVAALLHQLRAVDPNSERGKRYQNECNDCFPRIAELALRIRRLSLLAPKNENELIEASTNLGSYLSDMINNRQGNFDVLYDHIKDFNERAKKAHFEIIGQ